MFFHRVVVNPGLWIESDSERVAQTVFFGVRHSSTQGPRTQKRAQRVAGWVALFRAPMSDRRNVTAQPKRPQSWRIIGDNQLSLLVTVTAGSSARRARPRLRSS